MSVSFEKQPGADLRVCLSVALREKFSSKKLALFQTAVIEFMCTKEFRYSTLGY